MTSLLIGGTGRTGLALAKLLHAEGRPVLLTSRSGAAPEPFKAVAFDWTKPPTFKNPFAADSTIEKVYFIPPSSENALALVQPFLKEAASNNVKKFVMLATNLTTAGAPGFAGDIYQYFIDSSLDFVVLRSTWYLQNYSTQYLQSIKEGNYFFTAATLEGKTTPISTDDVADAAFEALTTDKFSRKAPLVLGPEVHSNEEIAKLFSSILGRDIHYKQVSPEERTQMFLSFGMPEADVKCLVDAEIAMSEGADEKVFLDPKELKILGKTTMKSFIEANVALWK